MTVDSPRPSFVLAVDRLSQAIGYLSAGLLLAMLGMICFDVFMRYVLNAPTTWATEISTYVLVAIALLGTAYTQRVDGHIRVEVLLLNLDDGKRQKLLLVTAWIGLVFLAFAG